MRCQLPFVDGNAVVANTVKKKKRSGKKKKVCGLNPALNGGRVMQCSRAIICNPGCDNGGCWGALMYEILVGIIEISSSVFSFFLCCKLTCCTDKLNHELPGKTPPLPVCSRASSWGKSMCLPNWLWIRNALFHQEFTRWQSLSSLGNERLWMAAAADSSGETPCSGAWSQAGGCSCRGEQISPSLCPVVASCKSKAVYASEQQ